MCHLNWEELTAIGTICLAIPTFVSLPQIQALISRPRLKLRLVGPNSDSGNQYWHVAIENKGRTLKSAGIYLAALRENGGSEQFVPFVRFLWPYEYEGEPPLRDVVDLQHVDLCSTEKWEPYEEPGKVHTAVRITKLKMPSRGSFLDLGLQVIGEQYQSQKSWFRLSRAASDGSLSVVQL